MAESGLSDWVVSGLSDLVASELSEGLSSVVSVDGSDSLVCWFSFWFWL